MSIIKRYSYRFKTEEEFVKEYGPDWECHAFPVVGWARPNMDYFFGRDLKVDDKDLTNTDSKGEEEYAVQRKIFDPNGEDWSICWGMLTRKKSEIPSYKPRKIDRTLESNDNNLNENNLNEKYKWDNIIIQMTTLDEVKRLSDYFKIHKNFCRMPSAITIYLNDYLDRHLNYHYIRIDKSLQMTCGTVDYLSTHFQDKYEKLFSIDELENGLLDNIKKYGISSPMPSYKPRNIERTMESNNKLNESVFNDDYKWNNIIFEMKTKDDVERAFTYFDSQGGYQYPDSMKRGLIQYINRNEMPYIRVDEDYSLNYGTVDYLDRHFNYHYERLFSVDELEHGIINNIKKHGKSSQPSYKPRKIERTLESVNNGYRFKTRREFENQYGDDWANVIHQRWASPGMDHLLGQQFNYNGPLNLDKIIEYPKFTVDFNYDRSWSISTDMLTMDNPLLPSYKPRKIERTLESNNELNEGVFNDNYKWENVIIEVKTIDDVNRVCDYLETHKYNKVDWVRKGVKNYVKWNVSYIRIGEDMKLNYGTIDILDDIPDVFWHERLFSVDELENGLLDRIKMYGKSSQPSYKPRKIERTLESNKLNEGIFNDNYNFDSIVIKIDNQEELNIIVPIIKTFNKKNDLDRYNFRIDSINEILRHKLDNGSYYIRIYYNYSEVDFSYGSMDDLVKNTLSMSRTQERVFSLYDLENNLLDNIKTYGKSSPLPSYKPRKVDRTLESYDLILEKSNLTKLGVPKEVMQSIQRDFAMPADAELKKLTLKRDAQKILRTGNKELILQISLKNIKVFVSYPKGKEIIYFIDKYIFKNDGWGGEYKKLDREYTSMTQLFSHIDSTGLIYHLNSEFSLIKQGVRKLINKEIKFDEFTKQFKSDFVENFDNILKRIVGSKIKDAKKDIGEKYKQIEIENKMMLSGLNDPITGNNSLTILDEFLMQFEDKYSDFFGERLDIEELCNYFTRDKMLTSFMYFIYTGKILDK